MGDVDVEKGIFTAELQIITKWFPPPVISDKKKYKKAEHIKEQMSTSAIVKTNERQIKSAIPSRTFSIKNAHMRINRNAHNDDDDKNDNGGIEKNDKIISNQNQHASENSSDSKTKVKRKSTTRKKDNAERKATNKSEKEKKSSKAKNPYRKLVNEEKIDESVDAKDLKEDIENEQFRKSRKISIKLDIDDDYFRKSRKKSSKPGEEDYHFRKSSIKSSKPSEDYHFRKSSKKSSKPDIEDDHFRKSRKKSIKLDIEDDPFLKSRKKSSKQDIEDDHFRKSRRSSKWSAKHRGSENKRMSKKRMSKKEVDGNTGRKSLIEKKKSTATDEDEVKQDILESPTLKNKETEATDLKNLTSEPETQKTPKPVKLETVSETGSETSSYEDDESEYTDDSYETDTDAYTETRGETESLSKTKAPNKKSLEKKQNKNIDEKDKIKKNSGKNVKKTIELKKNETKLGELNLTDVDNIEEMIRETEIENIKNIKEQMKKDQMKKEQIKKGEIKEEEKFKEELIKQEEIGNDIEKEKKEERDEEEGEIDEDDEEDDEDDEEKEEGGKEEEEEEEELDYAWYPDFNIKNMFGSLQTVYREVTQDKAVKNQFKQLLVVYGRFMFDPKYLYYPFDVQRLKMVFYCSNGGGRKILIINNPRLLHYVKPQYHPQNLIVYDLVDSATTPDQDFYQKNYSVLILTYYVSLQLAWKNIMTLIYPFFLVTLSLVVYYVHNISTTNKIHVYILCLLTVTIIGISYKIPIFHITLPDIYLLTYKWMVLLSILGVYLDNYGIRSWKSDFISVLFVFSVFASSIFYIHGIQEEHHRMAHSSKQYKECVSKAKAENVDLATSFNRNSSKVSKIN